MKNVLFAGWKLFLRSVKRNNLSSRIRHAIFSWSNPIRPIYNSSQFDWTLHACKWMFIRVKVAAPFCRHFFHLGWQFFRFLKKIGSKKGWMEKILFLTLHQVEATNKKVFFWGSNFFWELIFVFDLNQFNGDLLDCYNNDISAIFYFCSPSVQRPSLGLRY